MPATTMTIRLDVSEKNLIAEYARTSGISASEFMRRNAIERIEDEIDLKAWEAAKAEFDANPVTYSLTETKKMLGLT
ncbi:MAG: DUF6290 family protein [Coriobacteriales bacterium]|nr:DUF6290 family protein [Coriobacteriales bacterium]